MTAQLLHVEQPQKKLERGNARMMHARWSTRFQGRPHPPSRSNATMWSTSHEGRVRRKMLPKRLKMLPKRLICELAFSITVEDVLTCSTLGD